MYRLFPVFLLFIALTLHVWAGETTNGGRIVKTMPLLLDTKGHDALSPSLFDRDAYQAYLNAHTNEISGMRFDVLWHIKKPAAGDWKLRLELRGVNADGTPSLQTLETPIKPPAFRHWETFTLTGTNYQQLGQLVAWRTTLWHDGAQVSEQKSFLW